MDAFESVVALILRRKGYWTQTSVKVVLDRDQKRAIGRPTSPRWEIDLVAYKAKTNEILAVECKSYIDSKGVQFRDSKFDIPGRYKLFTDDALCQVVLDQLATQLTESGACRPRPKVRLALATGKIATVTDRIGLSNHFRMRGWELFDDNWISESLIATAKTGYENDVAMVVAKLIERGRNRSVPNEV